MRLRASTNLIVIMSACPQDLLPVNGLEQQPTNVHSRVHAATERRWLSCRCPLVSAPLRADDTGCPRSLRTVPGDPGGSAMRSH